MLLVPLQPFFSFDIPFRQLRRYPTTPTPDANRDVFEVRSAARERYNSGESKITEMGMLYMQRRDFVRSSVFTLSGALLAKSLPALALDALAPDPSVRRVLAMFKCHFDCGFIDTQANVVRWYFNEYYPQAISFAEKSRQPGGHRYAWTTGSWLLYEYLEQASAADRKRMEQAIADGDIAWHALPFSWQTEMIDQSMIAASIGLSHSLDRRFGRTTTGAKMTDVPGHTLGLVAPLAAEGVKFLDIGGNGVCTHPDVPNIFVWKDPSGASIAVINEPDYGGITLVPGSDLAISVNVRGDNSGPHPPDEVAQIYDDLHRRFPNAEIVASSLTEIANAIEPYRANLPVITQEIGDTWISGVASDPLKIARYLEIARLRQSWIAQGKFHSGDATDLALLRGTLLEIEHTWGADIKSWLDYDHYTPAELAQVLNTPHYKVVQFSWDEKRKDLLDAVATLPAPLRDEAEHRMRSLAPIEPKVAAWPRHDAAETIETKHFEIALDPKTGAICRLHAKKTGSDFASKEMPLALFSYQTLAKTDFDRFIDAYLTIHPTWAYSDLGKPKIGQRGAESRVWLPTLVDCRHSSDATGHKIVAQIKIDDPEKEKSGAVAWPQKMFLEYTLPDAEPVVEIAFSWFGKPPTRMPEALWLTFQPPMSDQHGWMMEKSGYSISPFDVVSGGNRATHAVLGGLHYKGPEGALHIETTDAPLVALGVKHPWYFTRNQPNLADGFHFCLFNNAWGTNYVMWFGEDMRYRFRIRA